MIRVAGGLAVVGPDGPVPQELLGGRRARTALAYLALRSPHSVPRVELAEAIWPTGPPPTWSSALRTALSQVRAAGRAAELGPDVLESVGDLVRLVLPPGCRVDLVDALAVVDRAVAAVTDAADDQLDRSALIAATSDALAVLERPVLPEIHAAWVDEANWRSAARLQVGLDALAELLMAQGDPGAAAQAADRALDLDPLRESSARLAMRAHLAAGRRAAALAAYDRCRTSLVEELGVDPSPETEQVHLTVLGGDTVGSSPLPASLRPRDDLPFVGRPHELRALRSWWASVRDGTPGLADVRGESGIGKSRLAREMALVAHDAGARVGHLRMDPDDGGSVRALARLVDGGAPPGPVTSPTGPDRDDVDDDARHAAATALAERLVDAASLAPLLVVVDDLQWAGTLVVSTLRQALLGAGSVGAALGLLITLRDEELAADHPALELLGASARDGVRTSVDLRGLDAAAVDELLCRLGGSELDESGEHLAAELCRRSAGSPFLLGEALRHGLQQGDVRCDSGRWSGEWSASAPTPLRDVVRQRVAALGGIDAGVVLGAAAVIGPEFDLSILATVVEPSGLSRAATAEVVDAATRARLVGEVPGRPGRFHFTHDLVRSSLDQDVTAARRAVLHHAAVRALSGRPQRGWSTVELARHAVGSAGLVAAADVATHCLAAAEVLIAQFAYEPAITLLDDALRLDQAPEQQARLLVALADIEVLVGDRIEGHERYLAAAVEAGRAGDEVTRARALLGAMRGHRGGSEWLPDTALREEAASCLAQLPDDEAVLRIALMGQVALWTHEPADRHGIAGRAMAISAARPSDDATVAAYGASRIEFWRPEDTADRLAFARAAVAAADRLGRDGDAAVIALGALGDELQLGDRRRFDEWRAATMARPVVERSHRLRWQARVWEVVDAVIQGRLDDAEALAGAALAVWDGEPHADAEQTWASQLAVVRMLQGRSDEVVGPVAAWVEARPDVRGFRSVLAWMLAESGDLAGAAAELEEASRDDWIGLPRDNTFGLCATALAHACHRLGDAGRAAELGRLLAPAAGQHLYVPGIAVYLGPVDHTLGVIAATCGRSVAARAHFDDAAAVATAFGSPWWAARSRQLAIV